MTRFSPFAGSLWHATAEPAPELATLAGEVRCDVCVVGGGYSGLTTALALAEAGVDTVLLEGEELGFGGSGRNAGHCTPTFHHHSIDGVRRLLGPERGARFIALQTTAADKVDRLVTQHQIRCEWVRNGYFMAAHTPSARRCLARTVESYNGVGQDTRLLDAGEAERLTGMRHHYGGWLHPGGGHLNPLGFARGLGRAAVAAGARLFVRSPVTGMERRAGRWRTATPSGAVTSDKLILATGAYSRDGAGALTRTFRIMRVFVAATAPMPEMREHVSPANLTLHDGRGDIFVYKRDAWDRLVVSMFPAGRRGRDLRHTRRVLTDRLRWQHPAVPATLDWPFFWTGELDMQQRTIPRLYRYGPGAVAVTGLSGRGVPTGSILGDVLSRWATEGESAELGLPVEELETASGLMAVGPRVALRYRAYRDRLREWREKVPSPPHP